MDCFEWSTLRANTSMQTLGFQECNALPVQCRRLRLNDDQVRRLAAKSKGLGRKLLAEVATIVTPERLLAWHRKLIAKKIRPRRGDLPSPARSRRW